MRLIAKKVLLSLCATLAMLSALGVFLLWIAWQYGNLFPDWDRESGYYGHFNRVKHVLQAMPNVQVTNHWQHKDVTLEDFGFFLLVDGTNSVRVDFWEGSVQMKERKKDRIRAFIQKKIEEARTTASMVASPAAGSAP
jgi:hypothetical protein